MITSFQELQILLNKCDQELYQITKNIKYASSQSDFKKISELETKEHIIRKKALRYIAFFKEKIADKHLENRLFGSKLSELEQHYKPYPISMEALIYCIEILKKKHEILNLDKEKHLKLRQFSKYLVCTESENKIEIVVEKLLKDCKSQISNLKNDNELIKRYLLIVDYFKLDLERKKRQLEMHLEFQKRKLSTLLFLFNFRKIKKLKEEILETEDELVKINTIIKFRNSE